MNKDSLMLLAQVLSEAHLTAIEMTEGDCRIRLEKYPNGSGLPVDAVPLSVSAAPVPADAPLKPVAAPAAGGPLPVDFNNLKEIKSPMVGVFYTGPAPGSEPYVKRGMRVRKGDVLCIIEAMKMMNEITSDHDGEIVDICAEEGQLVEFSQVLFKLY